LEALAWLDSVVLSGVKPKPAWEQSVKISNSSWNVVVFETGECSKEVYICLVQREFLILVLFLNNIHSLITG